MRALEFKIRVGELELKDWVDWLNTPGDHEWILDVSKKNHLEWVGDTKENSITFRGTPQNLFWFLHDVAYRYDIELV